ncbi:unnamed protein product [Ostreobium quekettii]|uniref:ABC transporter domain-containing protein n=1 Tax=Ostreobium quekettii TaxID=121088 RepID=A0A8S1J2K4_9CHLO|nr:unnamed protein product [Ostreobium quekettii]
MQKERGGSMFAILGPSGAGKTSLLDVLAGRRRGGVSGTVYVNGNKFDLRTKASYISSLVGYVYQDDILPGTSTVFEYLMFHSSLRLPPSVGHKEREWRATHLIDSLGLGRVAHSFIGDQFTRGLSGGEKRRVSIACEMLTSPSILFLDEPTTGLDSTNASKVVDILVDLSTANVNVIFSVHQPRADLFELVDRVLLLSSDGQTAYSGPAAFAERYFGALGYGLRQRGSYFMDYMLDVMIKAPAAEVDQLVEKFHTSDIFTDEKRIIHRMNLSPVELPSPIFRASYIRQLRCLSTRLLRNSIRHPLVISLNLVATFVVALFLGAMFWDTGTNTEGIQSRLGVLFFLILYFAAMSLSSLPIWRAEKLLFMRERAAGAYGTPAYFAAVLAFDLIPLRVIPPIFFGLFSYWMIGLHERCALCIVAFIGLLVMINMVASLMSMMIGAATPSNSVANAVGSLVIMVSLLFGGFLVNKDEIHDHVSWLVSAFANLSYFNFGYEALAVNEFDKAPVDFIFTAPITFKGQKLPPLRIQGDMVLCEFGFNKDQFFVDLMLLACIGGACALATFFLLLAAGRGWCLFGAPSSPRVQQGDVWHKGRLRADTQLQELNRIAGADATTPLLSEDSAEDGSRENGGNVDASAAGSLVVRPWAVRYPSAEGTSTPELLGHNALILSWDNISCRVWTTLRQMERKILSQVSGIAGPPPGDSRTGSSLFAIMGPSGAGKTTLLDILSGRKMDMGVTGDIRLSGHRLSAPKLRKACGYVLQDDVLPGTSTVWEYIMFHAQLRLPRGTEAGKIEERVKQIMDDLGLNKVANSYIGDSMVRGLSGGEKRRVSIACELLTQPGVLILDEPTTGLDSTNATTVVDMLASLASSGTTVIMSIHQPRPNFFHLMQQLMILSGDGQVVYTGTVPQAHDHFTSLGYALDREGMSVVDFALDLVIRLPRGEVDWMVSQFLRSDIAKHNTIWRQTVNADAASGAGNAAIRAINGRAKYATDHKTQLKVLSSRFLNNLYRHPMLLFLNFAAASLMAVVVGAVYWNAGHDTPGIQNRMGSLFFITMYLALMSLSSLPLWDKERLLFVRERASGVYGTTSYFAAVLIFDVIPMRILPPCFFALSYWMIGYRMSPHGVWASLPYIGEFLMILILVNIVASTLSMLIGAAMPTASVANMVGGFIVLVASLLSGGFLSRKQMSSGTAISVVDTLSRLSYMRYGVEALLINEFHGTDGYFFTVSYHCIPMSGKQPKAAVTGDIILETFGFWHSFTDLRWDVLVLVAFMVANLALTYLLFKYRGRPGEPSIGGRLQQVIVKLLPARWRKPRSKRGLLLEERGAIDGHLEEEAGC